MGLIRSGVELQSCDTIENKIPISIGRFTMKGIAEVRGFLCGVGKAGIKGDKPDVLVVLSEKPANFAVTLTQNDVKAAPVKISRNISQNSEKVLGIVANSGNANACTGQRGIDDALEMVKACKGLSKSNLDFLVASTGVIGLPLPIDKVKGGIKQAFSNIGKSKGEDVVRPIMTTDTFPKLSFYEGDGFSIGGIAKGAGMIDPSMATMLCFIATDASLDNDMLSKCLKRAVDESFNRITVDGDMSTNDSVFLLANGLGKKPSEDEFLKGLRSVTSSLAYQIVKDGEGSTKVIRVRVEHARDEHQAKAIARRIALSNLVKTAVFGNDPNWGRVLSAAGSARTGIDENKLSVYISAIPVFKMGNITNYDESKLVDILRNSKEVEIRLDLNMGNKSFEYLTSDLTYDYVRINAEYRT